MFNILERITAERTRRGWSEYELAKNSGISQSTISTWYRKHMQPSVSSLEKICSGLGITLSQFFSNDSKCELTPMQRDFLDLFDSLDTEEREIILSLLRKIVSK